MEFSSEKIAARNSREVKTRAKYRAIKGIRAKQRLLVEILTTQAAQNGTLRDSTKQILADALEFCAGYERAKRPFNHEIKGSE